MTQYSVMIAVPCMQMVHAEFAHSLAMASANMVAQGIKISCSFHSSSLITFARRDLVNTFMKSEFDHILWIDSDMKFPIDSPIKLLKRNKHIVGCNYRRRRFPNPEFTCMKKIDNKYIELKTENNSPDLEEVDVMPHGLLLVNKEVYKKVSHPHYIQEYDHVSKIEFGEDIFFSKKAKNSGYKIWCDHDLSKEISHIGTFYFDYNLSNS